MPILHKLRWIAAIVLVCTIVLPLSECSRNDNSPAPVMKSARSVSQQMFPRSNAEFTYNYGYENIGLSLRGAITVLAFTWPFIFVVFIRRRIGFRLRLFFQVLEVLLCAGSIYFIYALTFGGRWLYGAYLGVIAAAVFVGAGLASWFVKTKGVAEERSNQNDKAN